MRRTLLQPPYVLPSQHGWSACQSLLPINSISTNLYAGPICWRCSLVNASSKGNLQPNVALTYVTSAYIPWDLTLNPNQIKHSFPHEPQKHSCHTSTHPKRDAWKIVDSRNSTQKAKGHRFDEFQCSISQRLFRDKLQKKVKSNINLVRIWDLYN